MVEEEGALFIVSTPIGNLADITLRAIDVLREADLVLAEDTRHSRTLLDRYEVRTPVAAYHEHNEAEATPRVLDRLRSGERVALISDAGTPLLSDPGARLVRAAADAGHRVVPIPGASALLAALVASAIAADRFTFHGFLPRKGRERSELLDAISGPGPTSVLYEAAPRVADTLAELARRGCEGRTVAVARELTKQFEEVRRGTVGDLLAYYSDSPPRGEVVIVLAAMERAAPTEESLRDLARRLREDGLGPRDVAAALVRDGGAARNVAYRLAHES